VLERVGDVEGAVGVVRVRLEHRRRRQRDPWRVTWRDVNGKRVLVVEPAGIGYAQDEGGVRRRARSDHISGDVGGIINRDTRDGNAMYRGRAAAVNRDG